MVPAPGGDSRSDPQERPGFGARRVALRRRRPLERGAAGQLYGNRYTWPFISGWQSNLDTPDSAQMGYVKSLFEPTHPEPVSVQ